MRRIGSAVLIVISMAGTTPYAQDSSSEWSRVERAIGKAGAMQPGDVYKISLPRTDLGVTADGVRINPALALGSWLAFKKQGAEAMVMGDLVLTEGEINPVISKLQDGGMEITAIHNHLLHETPRVMYMHISGMSDPEKLAETIHGALSLTRTPLTSGGAGVAGNSTLQVRQLDAILGRSGKLNGQVLQYSVPRSERIADHGMEIPPSMGTATAINFQAGQGSKAAVTGDFVLLASEVNKVIRELRAGGIQVTALHSHMLTEEPRLLFMHFWGNDDPEKLARALKAALDKTNSKTT